MASAQAEAPVKEVTDEQAEKSTQQTPVVEEKTGSSEEAEVIVHETDAEEEEEEEEKEGKEETENEVNEENTEEKFAGSPIVGDYEPIASLDVEGEAEADVEEGDLI